MKFYAFILADTHVVGLVQGFGDDVQVDTSPDAYVVEVLENEAAVGDVYDSESGTFSTPQQEEPAP